MRNNFWCVKITKTGLPKRRGFVPRPKPAQNVNAFQSFSVTSPMTTGSCARSPVLCEEVVSLLCDKFSLAVSILGTLGTFFVRKTSSSVLLFFLVERFKRSKILFHSMKLASSVTLTPSLHQFPSTTRVYDGATRASKSVSDPSPPPPPCDIP